VFSDLEVLHYCLEDSGNWNEVGENKFTKSWRTVMEAVAERVS